MIPVHNRFPFTLSIKKFHTKTPYESRMYTVDWFYDRWTKYDETWQNWMPSAKYFLAIRQHVLTSDWLRHFSTLDRRLRCTIVIMRCQDKSMCPFHIFDFSETLNGIWGNFTGSKKSLSNTNVCVFRANKKKLWLSRPLIGWDIFHFSSRSATDFVAISSRHHRFRYTHRNILIKLLSILKTIYCYDIYIYIVDNGIQITTDIWGY